MIEAAADADDAAVVDRGLCTGLFGKLPAHGDFVRRGWADATVDALDHWLSEAMRTAREERGEDVADWLRAAPLWRGYVPPGRLGPDALHLGVAPSIDSAGRLFPLALGVAGESGPVWAHAEQAGGAIDAAIYDTLAGGEADAAVAAVDQATLAPGGHAPGHSAWWLLPEGAPVVESDAVDSALLVRLWARTLAAPERT